MKRPFGLLALASWIALGLVRQVHASCAAPVNFIEAENCLPGNPQAEWDSFTPTEAMAIFGTKMSIAQGETIDFKVRTTAQTYTMNIFRMGWYGGKGGRLIASLSGTRQNQPACKTDIRKTIDCGNWAVSGSWTAPANAVPGIYLVKAKGDNGVENLAIFIVRDDTRPTDIVMMTVDTTWQAYNRWGGAGLYFPRGGRGHAVSYNRPFILRGPTNSTYFNHEAPMVRWLEKNSYTVNYVTHLDLLERPETLKKHKIFLVSGHDEYISLEERNALKGLRDAGVHLALLTGNQLFWKTRWEPSIDGTNTPNRTMVCYKEETDHRPTDPKDPPTWTGLWSRPRQSPPTDIGVGIPPNELAGVDFVSGPYQFEDMTIGQEHGRLRFWRNTAAASLTPGTTVVYPQLIGYEWDADKDNGFRPLGLFRISQSLVRVRNDRFEYRNIPPRTHTMTVYRADSGALVWGAGTMHWAWGLDNFHTAARGNGLPDNRDIKQATVNMFADMGVQPGTLEAGLLPASQSTDNSPPTCTITRPTSKTAQAGQTLTVRGTASDTGGGLVAGIQVSYDGGRRYYRATGTDSWVVTRTPARGGEILCLAVDDSGNISGRTPVPPNPGGGGGPADNPAPTISGIDPVSVTAGGSDFTLVVNGANFVSGAAILWNGQTRTTNFVNDSQLTALITAQDIAAAGDVTVTVFNPPPGGGTSSAQTFIVAPSTGSTAQALPGDPTVYPNPWKAGQGATTVTFANILAGSTVKIFTISGRWVRNLTATGGNATWDLKNDKGEDVASGYYLYLMKNPTGGELKGKLAVIR